MKYKSLDRTILESNYAKIDDREVTFYYDSLQNIVLIKELSPLPRGNFMVSEYFFIDDKVNYKHDIDLKTDYMPVETFYVNNKVVKYIVGGEDRKCRINCELRDDSTPYEY